MNQKEKMPRNKNARKGSALLLSMVLLFVALSMAASLSYVTVVEQKMSSKTKSSVGAFYNAESGVEWALNKIANSAGANISDAFAGFSGGKYSCPSGFGCDIYFLDDQANVITADGEIDAVKAVRAVGTRTAGDPTQRAVEAAVAAGGCPSGYTDAGTYCIQTAEKGTEIWTNAATACGADGAFLCTPSQWVGACANKSLNDETDDWEWTAEMGSTNIVGSGGCNKYASSPSLADSRPYRCCANKE